MKLFNFKILEKIKNEKDPDCCLNFNLKYLSYIWNNPEKTKKLHQYIFNITYATITFINYYLVTKNFFYINGNIDLLTKTAAAFTAYFQPFLTVFPMLIYRAKFRNLLASRKRFWKVDRLREPELQVELDRVYNTGYRFLCLSYVFVAATGVILMIKSIFTGELFLECYIPEFPYAYELLLFEQNLYSPILCSAAFAMNGLYVSFCIDAMAQFKLLMFHLTNIRKRNGQEMLEFRKLIEYHNFLLKFVEDIQEIYSLPLLGQYVNNIGSTCMNLFTLTSNHPSTSTRLLSLVYLSAVNVLFSLYCFTATSLSSTMSEIPNSFYFSKWEDGPKEFRNCIPLCLMRAQRDFSVKAGGMMEINRGAVTVVFKTAYSVLLIFKNMKE